MKFALYVGDKPEELSEGGYELATNLHVHPVKWVLLMAEAL